MAITSAKLDQLKHAVADLSSEIKELEAHFSTWVSENTDGTKTYRPIAKRIVLSAQRLEQLVRENTY